MAFLDNSLSNIQKEVESIAQNLNTVDPYGHRHYKGDELSRVHTELESLLEKAKDLYEKMDKSESCENNRKRYKKISELFNKYKWIEEEITKFTDSNKISNLRRDKNNTLCNLFDEYASLSYDFKSAFCELRDNDYDDNTENMRVILLCKNVRIIEDIVNKICSNNIDKSIITGEKLFESMQYGFEWLFCHDYIAKNSNNQRYKHVDIRDRNRYLDFIKYQILIWARSEKKTSQIVNEIDEYDKEILQVFDRKNFNEKVDLIKNFKRSVIKLISEFFEVYKLLINFRDKIFLEEEIRKSISDSTKEFESFTYFENKTERPKLSKEIVLLSTVALRVLIDRFVSFVKINDLNFGNSTFNRSWFNYSELSNSNYSGSNFKYSRMENAKVKDCDISTCNFSCADGSGTDFGNSNFDYSNMTGINLTDAILNKCQFKNTIFRDADIDTYKSAIDKMRQQQLDVLSNESRERMDNLLSVWRRDNINKNAYYVKCICDLYKNIKREELEISSQDQVSILNFKNHDLTFNQIQTYTQQLVNCYLSKVISAELLDSTKDLVKYEGEQERIERENNYGKVLLDSAQLTKVSAKEVQMPKIDFSHLSMSSASFEDSDLSEANMFYTKANNTSFINSNLNGSNCFESYFKSANFSNAVANKAFFLNCNLNNTNWERAIINGITFIDASSAIENCLKPTTIERVRPYLIEYMSQMSLNENPRMIEDKIEYKKINVEQKQYSSFWQKECYMNESNFEKALADNAVFMNILAERSSFNFTSLKNAIFVNCSMHLTDFIESDFRYSIISCGSFGHSNFRNANLIETKILYSEFVGANLNSTLLNSSEMDHVLFTGTDLSALNLTNAIIKNCAFVDCNVKNMILYGARFENCVFDNLNFINIISRDSSIFLNCCCIDCKDDVGNEFVNKIKDSEK